MPHDLRIALRSLLRSPGFLVTAVGSLAIAIGASVAAFSVIDAVRLRALPFVDADRLVVIGETAAGPGSETAPPCRGGCNVSYETFAQVLRTHPFRSLDAVAAYTSGGKSLTRNGESVLVSGGVVSPNVFPLLGVHPIIGRGLTAEDDRLGVPLVTVLSHELWETQFGKDPGVIGTDVKLSDSHYTVVGVMPPGFRFETGSQFWLPAVPTLDPSTRPSIRTVSVFARLARGRTIADLRAELATLEPAVVAGPGQPQKTKLVGDPLRDRYASSTRSHDLIFAAIVACLLLIACANLANLVLARTLSRQREFAIRSALGAGAGRLARVLLAQNAVIVVAAAVIGVALAWSALGLLSALPALTSIRPDGMEYRIDSRVIAFATLVSVVAAILVSIVPARLVVRRDAHRLLRVSAATGDDGARWVQRGFVVGQVACATVLLTGAGLMARTVLHFARVDLGFNADRLVSGVPSFPHPWRVPEKYLPVTRQILDELARLPGVSAAGLRATNPLPRRQGRAALLLQGAAEPLPAGLTPSVALSVSPAYFETMGIAITTGRAFTDRDTKASVPVAIVNDWAARRWWPDRDAIGQTVRADTGGGGMVAITVVGVAANSKAARPNLLLDEDGPELYRPYDQAPSAFPAFFVAASSRPQALLRPVNMLLARLVPDRPVFAALVSQTVAQQLGGVRTNAMQILAFAIVGLLLAVIGVYGVLSFEVGRRTREIGIRSALGASRRRIAGDTVLDAARLIALGVVIGLPAASFASRLLAGLLYTTSPRDPSVFASVAACIVVVALVAAYVPARRAVRVDPIIALRSSD